MAAPAVRVGVRVGRLPEEQPARVEVGDERLVGLLEEHAADQSIDVGSNVAGRADRIHDRQAVGAADGQVVGTERRRQVHEPGAVIGA